MSGRFRLGLGFYGFFLIAAALLAAPYTVPDPVTGLVAANDARHGDHLGWRQSRLTSDLIEHSMMPSSDLELVNIHIDKIPEGYTERGTSFYLGNDLWLSARHVVNEECTRIIMIANGQNVDAHIKYLDKNADLAILEAHVPSVPALAIHISDYAMDAQAYAFGFPQGTLGATSDQYLGKTRLKFGGLLSGTAEVLAWTEMDRYPTDFDSLAGISGGPLIDASGHVSGIIVAASSRRGRNFTVAPEILDAALKQVTGSDTIPDEQPVPDIVAPPVSLPNAAETMNKSGRIMETYCIP